MSKKIVTPKSYNDAMQAYLDGQLPVIEAGTVGSKAAFSYSIDKEGNETITETDDDGNLITDYSTDESHTTTPTPP